MPAINSDSPAIFTNMKHNLNDFEKLLRSDVLQELTFSSHIKKIKNKNYPKLQVEFTLQEFFD